MHAYSVAHVPGHAVLEAVRHGHEVEERHAVGVGVGEHARQRQHDAAHEEHGAVSAGGMVVGWEGLKGCN